MMQIKTKNLILGAGISGCSAAQSFKAEGAEHLILEKNPEPGGQTRSININNFCFDYTGHFLHLSRFESPAKIPHAHQNDNEWQQLPKNSSVFLENSYVPAPFQYNLHALNDSSLEECKSSFHNRKQNEKPENLKEFLKSGFGEAICEKFLVPYNEKLLSIDLNEMCPESLNRFFPHPIEEKITAGFTKASDPKDAYNGLFWYPKKGGIGKLSAGLAKGLDIKLLSWPEKINLQEHEIITNEGECIVYENLISSIPLKTFCQLTGKGEKLDKLSRALSHNKVLCYNILYKQPPPEALKELQWVYLPENETPIYRVGFFSNICNKEAYSNLTAMYVETSFNEEEDSSSIPEMNEIILNDLKKYWGFKREHVDILAANWIDCAYVHFDKKRSGTLSEIFETLDPHNIHLIGRYGRWDYISMEDSIVDGLETALRLI